MFILKILQDFINCFINLICWRRGDDRDDSILFMTTRRIGRGDDPPTSRTSPILDIHPLRDEWSRVNFNVHHFFASPLGASVLEERGDSGANGEASSPLLLGFSVDALYIGGETLLPPDSSSSEDD
jgi:hypothetical protein